MSAPDNLGPQWRGMHRALRKHGGFSVNVQGRSPTTGYMVATPGHEEITPSAKFEPETIRDFHYQHEAALKEPGAHHGGWESGGAVYQDVAERFPPEHHAQAYVSLAARNEQEMFDVGKHGGKTENPAYEHALEEDRPRRVARSVSRTRGENVPGVTHSTRTGDIHQALAEPHPVGRWFHSALLPHPGRRMLPRTAGGPHPGP